MLLGLHIHGLYKKMPTIEHEVIIIMNWYKLLWVSTMQGDILNDELFESIQVEVVTTKHWEEQFSITPRFQSVNIIFKDLG